MKITKNELKEMINESVEKQLSRINHQKINQHKNHQKTNHRQKVNERSNTKYKFFPKNRNELKYLIKLQIKQFGNTVDLNDIDTSNITDMSYLFQNLKFNGNISK